MQLSIVIPTYNQGQFIADCIESIINQSYKDLEIIIQDSNSSDETERICKEYAARDKRINYFREKDSGQSDAINRGLKRSKGIFWTWICSDDRYSNHSCLEKLIQSIQEKKSPQFVGVFGKASFISESGNFIGDYYSLSRDLTYADFKMTWPLSQPSSILLRKRVEEVGGVVESLHLGMDLDLFIKMLSENYKFLYVDYSVADVRIQDNSKSIKYRKATALNALSIIKKYYGSIGKLNQSDYFREFTLTADSKEVRQFLSEYKFWYKCKYFLISNVERSQLLLSLARKTRSFILKLRSKIISVLRKFPVLEKLIRAFLKK